MPATSKYDCRKCGVCCAEGLVVPLRDTDVDRLCARYGPLMTMVRIRPLDGELYQPEPMLYEMRQEGGACWAFRGQVGKQCSCSIYRYRPDACREAVPGGKACREWLRLYAAEQR